MTKTIIFVAAIVAVSLVMTAGFVYAGVNNPPDIKRGKIILGADEVTFKIKTVDNIPQSGVFQGYGILTADKQLLVATSHGGVRDSQLQTDKDDPIWHVHYVGLLVGNAVHPDCVNNNPGLPAPHGPACQRCASRLRWSGAPSAGQSPSGEPKAYATR